MNTVPSRPVRVLWITPELQGGIASYSRILWPAVTDAARAEGHFELLSNVQTAPGARADAIAAARDLQPDLVHVQHEYGLFGGMNPFLDGLPQWMRQLRDAVPNGTRIVATAHNVVPDGYRLETRGQGWRSPLNRMANAMMLPWLRRRWREDTWGRFDGVIVHSALQAALLEAGGLSPIATIPHVVPEIQTSAGERPRNPVPRITVFGYFTPDKGQDVVIEALRLMKPPAVLRLAGGVRHPVDDAYHQRCRQRIADGGLGDRVEVTGFVPEADITRHFDEADLVVAPFRRTSGSGSLVQALSRGAPVLASDLPLNREINDRVPDTLAFFASEDPLDCARQIELLLADADRRRRLGQQALLYAANHSPSVTVREHLRFYRQVIET